MRSQLWLDQRVTEFSGRQMTKKKIERVMNNLLTNIIKFAGGRGEIVVTVRNVPQNDKAPDSSG
jgi:signal transduction histidine kinase